MHPSLPLIAAASLALAGCAGASVQQLPLSHGHMMDRVSDDRDMTVSRVDLVYDPDGRLTAILDHTAEHPAVSLGRAGILAGGMMGSAALLRPARSNVHVAGGSATGGDADSASHSEGGDAGAVALGGDASATGGDSAAVATGGTGGAGGAITNTSTSTSTATATGGASTGGGNGGFCPPGEPAPHC